MNNQVFFNEYLNRNHASLGNLINDLYAHVRSKLLVIRVDFIYRPEFRDQITIDIVNEHRARFLDNRRRNQTLFGDLLGYAWSLEHGSYRPQFNDSGNGFHHHFIFLFDGQRRGSDMKLGLAIANYFDTVITHGMSRSYVSNLDKEKFEEDGTLGIGSIAHNQISLRNNLLNHVAGYLTVGPLPDECSAITELFEGHRRFGRKQLPMPRPEGVARPGRPRSTEMK